MNFKFLSRLLAVPIFALGISLGQAAPAFGDLSLSNLVPATTVSLNPPVTCANGVTVFDSDDLATLCVDPSLVLPLDPPTCPQAVGPGFFRLNSDLHCVNSSGLIVAADNTIIDLNGHTIDCTGAGFKGSCQGEFGNAGVNTSMHQNVHVFSHVPGGTIRGFTMGVYVNGGSNVKVKQLLIDGPPSTGPGTNSRPASQGIRVNMANNPVCLGNIHIGGGVQTGNEVRNHTEGIELGDSNCVELGYNNSHDNNSDPVPCHGIHVENSAHLNIHHNNVHKNGENLAIDGGITLDGVGTTDAIVTGNSVGTSPTDANNGDGISVRSGAHGNNIVNNVMKFNGGALSGTFFFDAAARPPATPPANFWGQNNNCITQTTPEPPPGTCTATS